MTKAKDKLVVVWSSADKEVATSMVYMYTLNAKLQGWWKEVTFIVWGPSAKLLAKDAELQERLEAMKDTGIVLEACVSCSDMHGVSDDLRKLGIDVKRMGVPLTEYLKEGRKVITF